MLQITRVQVFNTRPRLSSIFQFGNVSRLDSTNIFVKVTSEDGVAGWGEACLVPHLTTDTPEAITSRLVRFAADHLVGISGPSQLAGARSLIRREFLNSPFAMAALDTALLDLRARQLGVPMWELLGGNFRTEILVHGSVGWDEDARAMAENARNQASQYDMLKTYLGRAEIGADLTRLETMRSHVPDRVTFFVDINRLWTAEQFGEVLRSLKDLGVVAVEQPTPGPTPEVIGGAREIDLAIVWDESIRAPEDVVAFSGMGAQGTVNVGISKMGGPTAARAASTVAEVSRLPVAVGSLVETGIGSLAGAHLAATIENPALPSYVMGFLKYETQLTVPKLAVVDGYLQIPNSPGLGVEVDDAALADITISEELIQ